MESKKKKTGTTSEILCGVTWGPVLFILVSAVSSGNEQPPLPKKETVVVWPM
jgi:hypothetical protein